MDNNTGYQTYTNNAEAGSASYGPTIIQTDVGARDGQDKCPQCGATDISLNANNGKLRCNYCRHEFEPKRAAGLQTDIRQLQGQVMGSGAQNIIADTSVIMTFKCSSCGAEVVIDTSEATQARCHWCRNTLSVNQQVPNGAVPDMVLPFGINRDTAKAEIEKYVGKRKFFAHPTFKNEFTTQNVMGVYLPYMVVDVNAHAQLVGQGEHQIRRYTHESGGNQKTYYDADLYAVGRDFDLVVNGLTVESSADKLNNHSSEKTNNVINAIMPFDIENSVAWNANYLKGYTSEKRDTNADQLRSLVDTQTKDIARHKANDTLKAYDRGVRWSTEQLDVKGQQWKAAYLPVWLYSYQQTVGNNNKVLHYVAVNARTKETVGSVSIHMAKLLLWSFLVEVVGALAMLFVDFDYSWLFMLSGFAFFFLFYMQYRQAGARHKHEKETNATMDNLQVYDRFIQRQTGLTNATMSGANNTSVSNGGIGGTMLNVLNQNIPEQIRRHIE